MLTTSSSAAAMYRSPIALILLIFGSLASASFAEDLMPPHVARQLGLTQAWMRPINAPYGAQTIADQQLYVHQSDPHEYIEIVQLGEPPELTEEEKKAGGSAPSPPVVAVFGRVNVRQVGKESLEAGRAEAQRLASNEVRRLKRRGISAVLQTHNVPRVNLYSLATNGVLEARNAETGEILWTVRVGDPRLTYHEIGVDDEFLTIINGGNLIQIDVNSGIELESVRTVGTPLMGAVNSDQYALVPIIGGRVEGYPLRDTTLEPFVRSMRGTIMAIPTKSPDSSRVAWGTDQGYVFVAEASGTPSILFRLDTDGSVSGPLAAAPGDRFFFGSENGQVYGLRATRTGEVLWSQPIGEPFYDRPLVVGQQLLISSTYGNMIALDVSTGDPTWDRPVPNIGDLIGAFDGRVYVRTLSGALAAINVADGKVLGIFPEVRPSRLLPNVLTNRLYLVSERGEVQCLRPEDSPLPQFLAPADPMPAQQSGEEPAEEEKPVSPFDPGAEPMQGGDADPFGGDADPFGGADLDDPFGGDDAFGDDDPFAP